MSHEDRPVPYNTDGSCWRMARQWAKLPKEMLSESVVFTPRVVAEENPTDDVKTLKAQNDALLKRLQTIEEEYTSLLRDYNALLKTLDTQNELVLT